MGDFAFGAVTTGPIDPAGPGAAERIKGSVEVHELTRSERAVVRRSAESRATVPHVEFDTEAQVDEDTSPLCRPGADTAALLVRACAVSLSEHPRANGAYRDGRYERYSRVNVGVVVAQDDTYAIPTIMDANRKSLPELSAELADLRRRALERRLAPPELSGATFTLWDAGAHGLARAAIPVVAPQAAAVAAGMLRQVPIVRDGAIVPGRAMTLVLVGDHRILYGGHAASFLLRVKSELERGTP
jgi:pyruvate dehydrogenase E2 component (dihydrolipoamide acetyltransferase)